MDTDDTAHEENPAMSSYVLSTFEGRAGFLWRLSEIGAEGLFAAVAHVWDSLAEPRAPRCAMMAVKVGLPGKGQGAIYGVLSRFLSDFEAECDPPPLPLRGEYASSADWHSAVNAHFAAGDAAMLAVIHRYCEIMDGSSASLETKVTDAVVLQGPWAEIPGELGS